MFPPKEIWGYELNGMAGEQYNSPCGQTVAYEIIFCGCDTGEIGLSYV